MYTAAVLRTTSGHLLRWLTKGTTTLEDDGFVFQTPHGEPLPHHMTVNLGLFDDRSPQVTVENNFNVSAEDIVNQSRPAIERLANEVRRSIDGVNDNLADAQNRVNNIDNAQVVIGDER